MLVLIVLRQRQKLIIDQLLNAEAADGLPGSNDFWTWHDSMLDRQRQKDVFDLLNDCVSGDVHRWFLHKWVDFRPADVHVHSSLFVDSLHGHLELFL